MEKMRRHRGFTLVELAIVLAIIGLLITGLLKGKQLMDNARITTTIAQIQGIEAAVTTFRDAYGFLPGDVPAPAQRIPNWSNAVTPLNPATNLGNGIVGQADFQWSNGAGNVFGDVLQDNERINADPANDHFKPVFFWGQLAQTGLLSGITYRGETLAAGAARVGYTHPAPRVPATAFIVGHFQGTNAQKTVPPRTVSALVPVDAPMAAGPVLLLIDTALLTAGGVLPSVNPAAGVHGVTVGLSPNIAAQIDRKLDDGLPGLGTVQFFGTKSIDDGSCVTDAAINGAPLSIYQENATVRECGLFLRLQS